MCRCNLETKPALDSIESILAKADVSALISLKRTGLTEEFFVTRPNNLRNQVSVHPPLTPRTDIINNQFAWRMSQLLHEGKLPQSIFL